MDDRAKAVVEDRVILVLAGNRVAMAAALAQAAELRQAEIPATRPLQEVTADAWRPRGSAGSPIRPPLPPAPG